MTPTAARRLLLPQRGAVENARDAVRLHSVAAAQRREVALLQAEADGTGSWTPLRPEDGVARHAVQFPHTDGELLALLTAFVVEGLGTGEVCLVIATPAHVVGLRHRLVLAGLGEEADDLLVELDAATTLRSLLRDGRPDAGLFDATVATAVRSARASGRGVRAFGEMVGLLYERGDLCGTLQLEQLWDGLQRRLGFPLLCAYPAGADDQSELRDLLCAEHSHLAGLGG